ncbi:hypothetical protein Tco_1298774 [Tanacetum coccineum]
MWRGFFFSSATSCSNVVTLLLKWKTDAKSGSVYGGFIALVFGRGLGVDNSDGGVKDCNDYGMTMENTVEESVITKTDTVRSVGVCWLGTS